MKTRWSGLQRLALLAAVGTTLCVGQVIFAGDDADSTLARFFGRPKVASPETGVGVELVSWNEHLAPVVKMGSDGTLEETEFRPIERVVETELIDQSADADQVPADLEGAIVAQGADESEAMLTLPMAVEPQSMDESNEPIATWQDQQPLPLGAPVIQPKAPAQPTSPPFEPISAASEMQSAQRAMHEADRQSLDAHRNWVDAQPITGEQQSGPQPRQGKDNALSNYYGQVTVNYYVSPGGQSPQVSPANFQDPASGVAEGYEVVPPGAVVAPGIPLQHGLHEHPPILVDDLCGTCGKDACCPKACRPCLGVFAEAMYLRPGNFDVLYATEQNGCIPGTSTPTGPQGMASPDIEAGFRAGLIFPVSDCSRLLASYTWFQSDTNSFIEASPNTVLASRVTHPNMPSCGDNSTSASAKFDIDFQYVDLDYQHVLLSGCNWGIGATAGVRYARLSQEFEASQLTGVATGLTTVTTDIDFDGVGVRMGLDGEYHSVHSGLFIYSKGTANFLGGQTQARYHQSNQIDPSANIAREYEDYRLTTILEAELGAGWQSHKGHVRLSCGFQANAWHNTLLTQAFIDGTTTPETNDDFATFSGLVGRIELRR